MKRLSFLPGLVILVISTALFITTTGFKKNAPVPVQLSISANFINGDNSVGSFTSSGFLNSSGTTAEQVQVNANTFHAQTTFTDSHGSFTAKLNGPYRFTSPTSVEGYGNWVIISGTGDYKKLHGTGEMTFTADFAAGTINDQWTGDMHIN
ncbi:MAG: hypothetical protein ABIW38_01070 [Ferruginibacter sp.]